jgi:hypothetical protein
MNAEKIHADTVPEIAANDNFPTHTKPPAFDLVMFEDDLTERNITKEQRLQSLRSIWDIMFAFVDMAWDIAPTQVICGKLIKAAFEDAADSRNTLESEHKKKLQEGGL